jgi:flavorubredoxin
MPVTDRDSGTRIDEIADRVFRISSPIPPSAVPGGFSFNQYLVAGDEPLLFHTGPRRVFAQTVAAMETVLPVERLRWIGFSHFESDECGAVNLLLAAAPHAAPVCGRIDAMINADAWDCPPRALADGEELPLGRHRVRWFDTPHLPHGWECGYLMEEETGTLLCGDLFTQPGADLPPLTRGDILGPSEAMRARLDYFSHSPRAGALLERLAACEPRTLACMHGSAWEGDGGALLRSLAEVLSERERWRVGRPQAEVEAAVGPASPG